MRLTTLESTLFTAIHKEPSISRKELLNKNRFTAGVLPGSYERRCDALDLLFMLGLVDSKYARPATRKEA
jgi:hypothetical protein